MTPSLSDSVVRGLQAALRQEERYLLFEEIGRGGMGVIYRAEDTLLRRGVALKIIESGLPQEAYITARLEHPGIVPVHDAGTLPDGRTYYAMKLIRGQRLDEWLKGAPGLAVRLSVFVRICEPVAFAHARGVVHRDLKPSNIMLGSFGEVLVLDWGVAAGEGQMRRAGTPGFMPPEADVSPLADVFGLGRIFEWLLPPEAPESLRAICRRATATKPEARYGSAAEMAADVNRFLAGERVTAHKESAAERIGRVMARHKALLALIAAYIVMRTALILFSWRP